MAKLRSPSKTVHVRLTRKAALLLLLTASSPWIALMVTIGGACT